MPPPVLACELSHVLPSTHRLAQGTGRYLGQSVGRRAVSPAKKSASSKAHGISKNAARDNQDGLLLSPPPVSIKRKHSHYSNGVDRVQLHRSVLRLAASVKQPFSCNIVIIAAFKTCASTLVWAGKAPKRLPNSFLMMTMKGTSLPSVSVISAVKCICIPSLRYDCI